MKYTIFCNYRLEWELRRPDDTVCGCPSLKRRLFSSIIRPDRQVIRTITLSFCEEMKRKCENNYKSVRISFVYFITSTS